MHPNVTAMSEETPTGSADSTARSPQEISAAMEVPYAVHRWFASGEGWAYHPHLDLRQVQKWAAQILTNREHLWQFTPDSNQLREARGKEEISVDAEHKLCLVYRHYADTECPDPKAQHRFPTVLIVALAHDLNDAEIEEVQKQLSALGDEALPQGAGCRDSLKLVVSRIATPCANDEPVTTDNTLASIQPDVHPDVQRPARRSFNPVVLCVSVAVSLAVGVIIYLGPVSPGGNDWSQLDPTRSSKGEEYKDRGDSPIATQQSAPTPSLDNPNTKSVVDQSPASVSPVQARPENATRWREEAAEAMFRHLQRWQKSGPLVEELGLNRGPNPRLEGVRRLLEVDLENKGWLACGKVVPKRENQMMIMRRFFLVLSREPIRHLLTDDISKSTWQGKFVLQFPEQDPHNKGACPRWCPESEEELRKWLRELEQWFKDHPAGAPNTESHKTSDAISDLVDRVAGRIDYFAWKQAVESDGQKLDDCTDPKLKKWVEDFRANTNGHAR